MLKIKNLISCFFIVFSAISSAQIYINGTLSTGANSISGVAAPTGYSWSEMQNNTGNFTQANATAGLPAYYNTAGTISYRIADDFIVPVGEEWEVSSIDFFGYQSSYENLITSPVDQLKVQIFNTDPSVVGATPIAGDMTANVIDIPNCNNSFIYRIFNSQYPSGGQPTNFTRRVWRLRGTLTATLPAGHYWIEFQVHPTNNTNFFFPPATVVGSRGVAGANAKMHVVASTYPLDVIGWSTNIIDSGTPSSAPDVAQDFPFIINGSVTTLGVNQSTVENTIYIAPNPVNDVISVSVNNATIQGVEIYDVNSRLIKNVISATNTSNLEVNVQELSRGIYITKLLTDKGSFTKKIVKE